MIENMDFVRFANFLQDMLEKYGAEVMEEILMEAEEQDTKDKVTFHAQEGVVDWH